jgi:hypothetical protein
MKKTITALSLALAAVTASANITAFATYDYNRDIESNKPWLSQHEANFGASYAHRFGTFDASLIGSQQVTRDRDNGTGVEIGYTNGIKLGPVTTTGRVGYGRVNGVSQSGGGFDDTTEYVSLGVEGALPLVENIGGFVGFRHRNGMSDTPSANRFTIGVDLSVAKNVAVRVGYAQTWQNGYELNGVTTALSYRF